MRNYFNKTILKFVFPKASSKLKVIKNTYDEIEHLQDQFDDLLDKRDTLLPYEYVKEDNLSCDINTIKHKIDELNTFIDKEINRLYINLEKAIYK